MAKAMAAREREADPAVAQRILNWLKSGRLFSAPAGG